MKKDNNLVMAKFDAESEWDHNGIHLPHITYKYYNNIILSMDELMIAVADKNDYLVTKKMCSTSYLKYMKENGFMCNNETYENISKLAENCTKITTYADIQEYYDLAQKTKLIYDRPKHEVVRKVNSKEYSVVLAKKLGLNNYSYVVKNLEQLKQAIDSILTKYDKVMIKEEYGVSGKGNLILQKGKQVIAFLRRIEKQCTKQNQMIFVVEPVFNVIRDFSTQLIIHKTGEIEFVSVQEVFNKNGVYGGSINVEKQFIKHLHECKYFCYLKKMAEVMFRDGYYGDVCIDSMIIKGNIIIPMVEINARKSMSLIKSNMDKKIGGIETVYGCLLEREILYKSQLCFDDILNAFDINKMLLKNGNMGVAPITCNPLFINRDLEKVNSRGRMYFYVNFHKRDRINKILLRLDEILNSLKG